MVGKTVTFEATRPLVVDATHTLASPIVLSSLRQDLASLNPEDIAELVIRNNKGLFRDVCIWCERTGNDMIASEHANDNLDVHCLIQKGEGMSLSGRRKMVVVVGTAELEKAVGVLEKALGGAVMGMEVLIWFEGSGVRIVREGYRPLVGGVFGRLWTRAVEGCLRKMGRPLPREAINILEELGASFFVCGPSLERFGVREEELSVKNFELGSIVMLVDMLDKADVALFSSSKFERP
ncbi:uncharacterized protein L3040_006918 [Drepanopeziza brunnea f. sp. 'multigermtubi']|uniref:Pyridine nucleotide-disulfide oxidoreductase n=1 Tax=Marssonina brunnea f. sp. multigermtubi (strain MB_m1) TaxID=1072389 RepID=K1WIU9_MARBU|nr:pyridine nucleotide-disulfide oxidoreductase [Drepanopeziza brunnea f. sp. 'multigermtubi' MB_m1]EKD12766.1 pyridine nucleotide-disulfide oxidoreductase [Drepanopeziza brunnea f. sp. 'multigermtubi' MB_m1]KAJ5038047.1 hypothetical protein L3040_006918 [Drepanopeziza brunnea f. sp. 'multigermtubi']